MSHLLSTYETELVLNADIIHAKNKILKTVYLMFEELSYDYKSYSETILAQNILEIAPKISRGENYLGLPYLILDYPRNFTRDNVFAIRTFFWWGNFFSITMHLAGIYKEAYETAIKIAISEGLLNEWFIGVNANPWQHHFEAENYKPITNGLKIAGSKTVIKLAKKTELINWEKAPDFFLNNYKFLIDLIST